MDRKAHWEGVYATKGEREVSWFQEEPALSLELVRAVSPARGRVIDVGGGASVLLDVCRYNAEKLECELGEGFSLIREARETHTTPWGSSQPFFYGVFKRG
jgi:hypothetical protein